MFENKPLYSKICFCLCWVKLHEIEGIWTPGRASLAPLLDPPLDRVSWGIPYPPPPNSKSVRYVSYWNAFLLSLLKVKVLSISVEGQSHSGVRYITKDLICKLTKKIDLGQITTLNLTLAKECGKKIKVNFKCWFKIFRRIHFYWHKSMLKNSWNFQSSYILKGFNPLCFPVYRKSWRM